MAAVVERLAGAPVPEPVPVVRVDVVLVRLARCGALPEFPVELGGNRHHLADADALARVAVPGLAEIRPADQPFLDLRHGLDRVGRRSLLVAQLDELAVLLLRRQKQFALVGVVARRLLDVHVLAGLEPHQRHRRVPVLGGGDGDGIDVLRFEELADVPLLHRRLAERLLGLSRKPGELAAVDVADVGHGAVGGLPDAFQVRLAPSVQADDGEVDAIVRAEDAGVASGVEADGHAGRADRHVLQELASRLHGRSSAVDQMAAITPRT